jgi:hypothetical protein
VQEVPDNTLNTDRPNTSAFGSALRMRKTIQIIGALVLTCVAFVAGAWTATQRGWGADTVTAQIINASEQSLNSIAIQFETTVLNGSSRRSARHVSRRYGC